MRKKCILFIKTVIFLVLLAAVLLCAVLLTERKESHKKYSDFFKVADQLDVLFLGSSHVINGINPMQLYEDYGMTSYNMGGHGSVLPSTYWEMENALNYCSPKVVVVDTYMLEKDYHYLDEMYDGASESDIKSSVEQLHLNMDCWPLSKTKIAAVKDLIHDKDTQKEFLFDFELYHGRWEELGSDDFGYITGTDDVNVLMGAEQRYEVDSVPTVVWPDLTQAGALPRETEGVKYLRRIIEDCQNRGIQVVLTCLPMTEITSGDITQKGTVSADAQAANTAAQIAQEYNVPFLNMLENKDLVDCYLDFNDSGHLNAEGMQRVTQYVGDYLHQNMDLADHRGEDGYAYWESRKSDFQKAETDAALSQDDLYEQLMAAGAGRSSYAVYIRTGSVAMQDPELIRLIERLSGSEQIRTAYESGGPYLLGQDLDGNFQKEFVGQAEPDPFDVTGGTMEYVGLSNFAALYRNGDEDNNLLDMDAGYNSDVQVVIFDRDTGDMLQRFCWKCTGNAYEKE